MSDIHSYAQSSDDGLDTHNRKCLPFPVIFLCLQPLEEGIQALTPTSKERLNGGQMLWGDEFVYVVVIPRQKY